MEILGACFALVFMAVAIGVLWVLPIVLGVRTARRKGFSPHWMWFGVHPVGGWVAFIVLSAVTARKQCPNCGGFISINFRICPYCQHQLAPMVYAPPQQLPQTPLQQPAQQQPAESQPAQPQAPQEPPPQQTPPTSAGPAPPSH